MTRVNIHDLSDEELERLYNQGLLSNHDIEAEAERRIDPQTWAMIDGIAYGLARLLNTPIDQLAEEAEFARSAGPHEDPGLQPLIGAAVPVRDQLVHLDQLVNAHENYWSALSQHNPRATALHTFIRHSWDPWLMRWSDVRASYDGQPDDVVENFVRSAAQGLSKLREIAATSFIPTPDLGTSQHGVVAPNPNVSGSLWDDITSTAKSAYQHAASFVHHPPGWFATVFPLMTMENQRYWAGKLGGSSGEKIYDAGVKAVASKYLGPQGAQLVDAYNKVVEDAAKGNTNAAEILAHAPEIAKLAIASHQGPAAFQAAVAETKSTVTVKGEPAMYDDYNDAQIGSLLPLLLGIPLGALGGYLYRGWHDQHPNEIVPRLHDIFPQIAGEVDIGCEEAGGYTIGTWVDLVGAEAEATPRSPWQRERPPTPREHRARSRDHRSYGAEDRERMRVYPQTKALIQSAIAEAKEFAAASPSPAFVWSLDPPMGQGQAPGLVIEGTSGVMGFDSVAQALDYMRERIQSPHVALALFDRTSPHWPNPINWTKSNDPADEPTIAQQIARHSTTTTAGAYAIGNALDDVRARAQSLAAKRAGDVVGVIHTAKDNLWHALAFSSADDADDWLGTATHDPAAFTYAAYYDKTDFTWPHPMNEKIGGTRAVAQRGSLIRRGSATTGWAAR